MLHYPSRRYGQPQPRAGPVANDDKPMSIKFRCPAELHGKLPAPLPATLGLPGWLKAMPTQAYNAFNMREEDTIKRFPHSLTR